MKSSLLIFILTIAFAFVACRKKNNSSVPAACPAPETAPPVTYDHYFSFKSGNCWIYERYQVEQNGSSASLHEFDSVYIEKDTLIRNSKYWKIRKYDFLFGRQLNQCLRDSLHYIIDQKGKVCFSAEDYSTIFSEFYGKSEDDTVYYSYTKMNDRDLRVKTAAGSFLTSNFQTTILSYPKYSAAGMTNPRCMNTRYCKDIGIIAETEPFFLNAPYVRERRLIRYHLN